MQEIIERYRLLYELLAPAVHTGLGLAVAAAVVGVFVLLRRQAMLALAMPQVVAAGAAFGLRFLGPMTVPPALAFLAVHTGWPTLPPAVVAVGVAALLIGLARRGAGGLAHALLVPCLYVGGLCLSFLLIAGSGEHLRELQNRFTGMDVAVDDHLAEITVPTLLACGLVCALLWRRWLVLAQSPAAAQVAGLRPAWWDAGFLLLLSAIVLLGTNALGAVMVIALLFLPPAAALPWTRRLPSAMLASTSLALALYAAGFVLSNEMDWPLSQSVGGAGFGAFLLSHLVAGLATARGRLAKRA